MNGTRPFLSRLLSAVLMLTILSGLAGGTAALGWLFAPLGVALCVGGWTLSRLQMPHRRAERPDEAKPAEPQDGPEPPLDTAPADVDAAESPQRMDPPPAPPAPCAPCAPETPDAACAPQDEKATHTQALAELAKLGEAVTDGNFAARSLSQNAAETSEHAKDVANSAGMTAQGVQAVAAAAEELSHTTLEISRQIVISTDQAASAASEVNDANDTVAALTEAARQIGAVVDVIREIADQTNLLALNATIEAARAGDAGRGFAVVASEVKALAQETAKATGSIGQEVQEIQGRVGSAVTVIKSIGQRVIGIHEIVTGIAAATEEQSVATNEITANVNAMAEATSQISDRLELLCMSAEQTDGFSEESHMAFEAIRESMATLQRALESVDAASPSSPAQSSPAQSSPAQQDDPSPVAA